MYGIFTRAIFERYGYERNCQNRCNVNVHNLEMIEKDTLRSMVVKVNFWCIFKGKDRSKTCTKDSNIQIDKDRPIISALS